MFFKMILVGAFLAAQAIARDGSASYYNQYGTAGSCGRVNSDSAQIVSISNDWQLGRSPSPYCGRRIRITNTGGGQNNYGVGKTIEVTVADTCQGCSLNNLDLSVGAFTALTNGPLDPPGRFNIRWDWI